MGTSNSSSKRQIFPAVLSVVLADGLVLFLALNNFELPITNDWRLIASRGLTSVLAPALVLLLADLLPAGAKDVLVFWRFKDALPGHRAFTSAVLSDPRIDRDKLAKNLTFSFPSDPREQNTAWYRLFKKVEGDPVVHQGNRKFLLFRELAAISALIAIGSAGGGL